MTSGNRSWTIIVKVGGKNKTIYLGTQLEVNEMLDKIEGEVIIGLIIILIIVLNMKNFS
jgi:hypothetical protein